MGIVVASRLGTDQRDLADGLRLALRAGAAVLARVPSPRADARSDDRPDQAGSGVRPAGRAGQLRFHHRRHRLHRRRGTSDHRGAAVEFFRIAFCASGHFHQCGHFVRAARHRDRPLDRCRRGRDAGCVAGGPTRAAARSLPADGNDRRQRLRLRAGTRGHRAGRDGRRASVRRAAAVAAGVFRRNLAHARADRVRADGDRIDRGCCERARRCRALGPAHRRQSGVHRAGIGQHRRRVHLQLSDVRLVQPHRRQLRGRGQNAAGGSVFRRLSARGAAAGRAAGRVPADGGDGGASVHHRLGTDRSRPHPRNRAHRAERSPGADGYVSGDAAGAAGIRDPGRSAVLAFRLSEPHDASGDPRGRARSGVTAAALHSGRRERLARAPGRMSAACAAAGRRLAFLRRGRSCARRARGDAPRRVGASARLADRQRDQLHRRRRSRVPGPGSRSAARGRRRALPVQPETYRSSTCWSAQVWSTASDAIGSSPPRTKPFAASIRGWTRRSAGPAPRASSSNAGPICRTEAPRQAD